MSSLKTLFSGAAPLGAALSKQVSMFVNNRFYKYLRCILQVADRLVSKRKGKGPVHILQGYGLTETSPTTHLVPPSHAESKIGSIGILLPNLEARLVVDGDGDGNIDAEEGQPGEIWIKGPTVMKVSSKISCLQFDILSTRLFHRDT